MVKKVLKSDPDKETPADLLQLDIEKILKARAGKGVLSKLPSAFFKPLADLICQDKLNEVLQGAYPMRGEAFAARALELLSVRVECFGLDNLSEGRYVFASNHPLGGLDGLALIAALSGRFGNDSVRFPVNDLLMNVTPLAGVFTPLNKYGAQGRGGAEALNRAFESDKQIAMFPAGLVSRLQTDGTIADLRWHKTFLVKGMETGRSIVPVYIDALNRTRFYKTAKWRKKLGLKVNVEQALLPSELCHAKGMVIRIYFGAPLTVDEIRSWGLSPAHATARVRILSDSLKKI